MAPRFEEARAVDTVGGTLTLPPAIEMLTQWGKTQLRWEAVGSYSTHGADLRFFPEINVEFDEPPTIDQTWGMVVRPLLQLFTLFTGEGDFVESVRYRTDGDHDMEDVAGIDSYGQMLYGGWFEWMSSSWFAAPNDKPDTLDYSHLVSSGKSSDEFGQMLRKWIDLQSRADDALADYFSTLMWSSMTFEESFAHIVRALEVLHSVIEPGPRIPKAEFSAVRKKIKSALEDDPHRELILSRLKYADAFSLVDRLKRLVGLAGPRLQSYAGDLESFARKVRNARDGFTHTSSLVGSTEELADAHVVLDLVMRSVLLIQLGIPPTDVDEPIFRLERARLLVYPVEPASKAVDPK